MIGQRNSNSFRILLVISLAAGYLAIYLALYRTPSIAIALLLSVPTAIVAWRYGLRAGLVAAVIGIVLNIVLVWLNEAASLSTPTVQASLLLGCIVLFFFTVAIGLVRELSEQLGGELARREQAEKVERQRSAELEAVYNASLQVTSSLELKPTLDTVLSHTAALLDAFDVHVFLYDGERLTFGTALWHGKQQDQPFQEPRRDGLTYRVARTGQRLIIGDVSSHELFAGRAWDGTIGGFPLSIGDHVYGVMNIAFDKRHQFTSSELRIIELLASQAAVAIRNAQDYQITRQHAQALEQSVAERTAELEYAKESAALLANNSSDVILRLSADGVIRQTNPAFDRVFGGERNEGQAFTTLFQDSAAVEETLKAVVAEDEVKQLMATARHPGGNFPAELVFAPLEGAGAEVEIICNLRDVTERQRAEERQRALVHGLRQVLAISFELISSPDVDALWKRAVEMAREVLSVERCSIFIERGSQMCGTYGTSLTRETTDEHGNSFLKGDRTWARLEHIFALDTPTWEIVRGTRQEWDSRKMIALSDDWFAITPIHSAYRFIGILFNDTAISGAPPDDIQQEILAMYCSVLGSLYEHKRVEDDVHRALEHERELSDLKSRFTTMISHELRTPLATIQLASDLLKDYNDRLGEQARLQHINKIQGQVKHLTNLLEDALTYTKAEQVGLQIQSKPVDLQVFCTELCAEVSATNPRREITCTAEPENWTVSVDSRLMRQALMNLLSNAVKYSPEGSPVTLTLAREEQDAIISVTDRGIGVPESDLTHIFEVFYRATNVGTIPGTGLGLPLVRQIAEAHHGFVFCVSQPGVGTTFTLRIPVFA